MTLRLVRELPPLRRGRTFHALQRRFCEGKERHGFRLVHFVVMSTHLHLIVEADDRRSLSRGMQGLAVRIAKCLNDLWRRKGRVFIERYHEHVLRTPLEVKRALTYVLNNARRHGIRIPSRIIDPFSSGRYFAGWRGMGSTAADPNPPVVPARTWLLRVGWIRHGRVDVDERPGRPVRPDGGPSRRTESAATRRSRIHPPATSAAARV